MNMIFFEKLECIGITVGAFISQTLNSTEVDAELSEVSKASAAFHANMLMGYYSSRKFCVVFFFLGILLIISSIGQFFYQDNPYVSSSLVITGGLVSYLSILAFYHYINYLRASTRFYDETLIDSISMNISLIHGEMLAISQGEKLSANDRMLLAVGIRLWATKTIQKKRAEFLQSKDVYHFTDIESKEDE